MKHLDRQARPFLRPSLFTGVCLAAALTAGCGMMQDSRSSSASASAAALSPADQAFATMAAGSGMYEVGVARLAVTRAVNPQVKAYAQMLVDHHTMANTELMRLLSARGMKPPTAIPADKEEKTRRLSGSTGAEFDRQFVRGVGIDDHTMDVALFERESSDGADPELRAWATKTLPTLQAHLQAAQGLQASVR
jgi:putative membrane protein